MAAFTTDNVDENIKAVGDALTDYDLVRRKSEQSASKRKSMQKMATTRRQLSIKLTKHSKRMKPGDVSQAKAIQKEMERKIRQGEDNSDPNELDNLTDQADKILRSR